MSYPVLLCGLQNPEGNMQRMLANLTGISSTIVKGEGTVGRLLAEETMADNIENLISKLNQDMQRIEPLFKELQATIDNVSQITAKINKQSGDLPELTIKLKNVLDSVQAVCRPVS